MFKILLFWIFIIMLSSCTKSSNTEEKAYGTSWETQVEAPVNGAPQSSTIKRQ